MYIVIPFSHKIWSLNLLNLKFSEKIKKIYVLSIKGQTPPITRKNQDDDEDLDIGYMHKSDSKPKKEKFKKFKDFRGKMDAMNLPEKNPHKPV